MKPADQIGQWVEVTTPEDETFYAKVVAIDEQPGSTIYTVHRFPAREDSPIHTFAIDTEYEQPIGEYPDLPAAQEVNSVVARHGGLNGPWKYCGNRACWECNILGLTD